MSQVKSILKNTLVYAIGNFGSKFLAFMLLPLYSFYLTKDEFGTYDLFIVTINLLAPLISLQISDATYRWLIDKKNTSKTKSFIIFNGFILITISSLFFYVFYFIITQYIHIKYSNYFALLLLISLYIPFFQKVLRGLNKNKIFAISGILNTFFILVLNILFLSQFNLKIKSLFLASIISNLLVLVYILSKLNLSLIFKISNANKMELKSMVKYSLPLVPNSISWWLINASDKYLILYFINTEANGIYAISTRFPAIIMLLNSIFLMAWQDHGLSVKISKETEVFQSKLFNTFITLELTFVIFLISISPYLIKYLISPTFYEAWKYLPLLFIGTAFSAFSAFIGVGYQRAKKTKGIFTTSLIGGIINIFISLSLINIIGLYAPALGTFISFTIIYIIRKLQTNNFFYIKVNNQRLIILVGISILFIYLIQFESYHLRLGLVFLSLLLFLYLNKKILLNLLHIVKQKAQNLKNTYL